MVKEKKQQLEKKNRSTKKQIKTQKKTVVKKKQTSLKRSKLNLDLMNQKKHKKKSLSVLIVNILLIVVALVIVLVVLNFGSVFTKGELSSISDVVKDYKKSDVELFLNTETLKSNSIQIKNSSSQNLKITGYSIISKMNASLLNKYIFFEENEQKNLPAGGITTIPIACYPEREFNLEILFEDETKAVKKIITSDYDFGRCLLPLYLEPFKREVYNFSFEEYCGDECDLELIEVKQLHNHGHWETRVFNIDDHDYLLSGMPYLPFGLVFHNKKLRHSARIGTSDFHLISPQNLEKAPQLYELIFDITSFDENYTVSSFLEVEYDYCVPGGFGEECDLESGCYISNSYSSGFVGPVINEIAVGGLVGYIFYNYVYVTNCFYDSQTSGQQNTGKGEPKTTLEMNTRSTFENAGWDFINTWAIDERFNEGYPYHKDNRPR